MVDGMLSQEEIDALLNVNMPSSVDEGLTPMEKVQDYLSAIEIDTIGEIGNISFGSAATTLSTLLNQKVDITTPKVSIIKKAELTNTFPFKHVAIQVSYVEGFSGTNLFVIKQEDAAIISDIMTGGDGRNPAEELNEIHFSAVQEAMNQMMGAAATSMSTIFNKMVNISPPTIELNEKEDIEETIRFAAKDEQIFVKVSFQLIVGDLIDSNLMQLIPFPFAHELVEELLRVTNQVPEVTKKIEGTSEPKLKPVEEGEGNQHKRPKIQNEEVLSDIGNRQNNSEPQYIGTAIDRDSTIQSAAFSSFEPLSLKKQEQRNLDMLLDIPLKVTVELGRTNKTIKDILELTTGSIIELDKLAGEPVDILVNEKLIAKGEVVVIDENFGVRITDVVSQNERLMKLK